MADRSFESVSAVLRHAAGRAESQHTLEKAVRAAWGALHIQPSLMPACFDAWRAGEASPGHASKLEGVLLRRYKTPADIAESLRRSAAQAEADTTLSRRTATRCPSGGDT